MDSTAPMDLNRLVANTPGTTFSDGVYTMENVLQLDAGTYCLSDDLSAKEGISNLHSDYLVTAMFPVDLGPDSSRDG